MQIRRDLSETAFETENLQKQVDGLSFRFTLILLFFAGLLAAILFVVYGQLQKQIQTLESRNQEIFSPSSPNHPVQQQIFQLSVQNEELSLQVNQQKAAMKRIQDSADKTWKETGSSLDIFEKSLENLAQGIRNMGKGLETLDKRLTSIESQENTDPKAITALVENLHQLRRTLATEGEERKKIASELANLKRENTQEVAVLKKENLHLRQAQETQKGLMERLQRDMQTLIQAQQNDQKTLLQIRSEQQALQKHLEKLPKDAIGRTDFEALLRRNDNERTALENRIHQRFQQIQISLDAAIRSGTSPVETGPVQRPTPIVEQELLQQ